MARIFGTETDVPEQRHIPDTVVDTSRADLVTSIGEMAKVSVGIGTELVKTAARAEFQNELKDIATSREVESEVKGKAGAVAAGKKTPEMAMAEVTRLIRSRSQTFPGLASEFNAIAGRYFSTFGEGGAGIVTPTGAEKTQAAQISKHLGRVAASGFWDPVTQPSGPTAAQLAMFDTFTLSTSTADQEIKMLELSEKRGTARNTRLAQALTDKHNASMLPVLNYMNGVADRGETLTVPQVAELKAVVRTNALANVAGSGISLEDQAQVRASVEATFPVFDNMIDSFSKLSQSTQTRELVNNVVTTYGITSMVDVALIEAAGGSGEAYLQTVTDYSRMSPGNQEIFIENLIATGQHQIAANLLDKNKATSSLSQMLVDVMGDVPLNPSNVQTSLQYLTNSIGGGGDLTLMEQQLIEQLIKKDATGGLAEDMLYDLVQSPANAAAIQKDPRGATILNIVKGGISSKSTKSAESISPLLEDNNVSLTYDPVSRSYHLTSENTGIQVVQRPGPLGTTRQQFTTDPGGVLARAGLGATVTQARTVEINRDVRELNELVNQLNLDVSRIDFWGTQLNDNSLNKNINLIDSILGVAPTVTPKGTINTVTEFGRDADGNIVPIVSE